jgi:hypothetical protein
MTTIAILVVVGYLFGDIIEKGDKRFNDRS